MKRPYLLMKRAQFWYFKLPEDTAYHSTGLRSRAAAEAWVLSRISGEDREAAKLADFAEGFFKWDGDYASRQRAKGRRFGKANALARQRHLEQYILPAFGRRPLGSLTRPAIETWLLGLPLANQTRNHILYTFRIVLREAVDAGLLAASPLARVEPLGRNTRARDVFTAAELRALFPRGPLAAVWGSRRTGTLFILLASTGIRSGEARALRWRDVLLDQRVAIVENTCIGGTTEIGPISAQKGGSKVAILPERTAAELEGWRKKSLWREPDDLVFPGRARGVPLGAATVSHALPRAIARLAREAAERGSTAPVVVGGRNLVVHSFRHTWITAMRRLLPQDTLQRLTGHHSSQVTDLYDHPRLEQLLPQLEPARDAVEQLFMPFK